MSLFLCRAFSFQAQSSTAKSLISWENKHTSSASQRMMLAHTIMEMNIITMRTFPFFLRHVQSPSIVFISQEKQERLRVRSFSETSFGRMSSSTIRHWSFTSSYFPDDWFSPHYGVQTAYLMKTEETSFQTHLVASFITIRRTCVIKNSSALKSQRAKVQSALRSWKTAVKTIFLFSLFLTKHFLSRPRRNLMKFVRKRVGECANAQSLTSVAKILMWCFW